MNIYTGPTPPIIGTRVLVIGSCPGHADYETTVTGFDPSDGAVFTEDGEIVANHLDDCSDYEVLR